MMSHVYFCNQQWRFSYHAPHAIMHKKQSYNVGDPVPDDHGREK